MAKKSIVARNLKRMKAVEKYADLREKLKKEGNYEALQQLPRNGSATRVRSRCSLTGRGRGVYRKFGVCRHMLRKLAHEGKLPGVKKASW